MQEVRHAAAIWSIAKLLWTLVVSNFDSMWLTVQILLSKFDNNAVRISSVRRSLKRVKAINAPPSGGEKRPIQGRCDE